MVRKCYFKRFPDREPLKSIDQSSPKLGEKEASGEEVLKDEAEHDVLHVEGEHRLEQTQGHRAHLREITK